MTMLPLFLNRDLVFLLEEDLRIGNRELVKA